MRTKFSNLSVAIDVGLVRYLCFRREGVSRTLSSPLMLTHSWYHGRKTRIRGKKDILTKVTKDSVMVSGAYYPVVSNIGSRTISTPANTTVLFPVNLQVGTRP